MNEALKVSQRDKGLKDQSNRRGQKLELVAKDIQAKVRKGCLVEGPRKGQYNIDIV
jgi:hypothetical protein